MRQNRLLSAAVVLSLLIVPVGSALASDTTDDELIQVAVLDVAGSGPVDPKYVEGLSGVLAAEVAVRPGLAVTTSADIRQVLGLEAERMLLGCEQSSCMAEIGGALGVDFLISAEVSKVGANWLLNAALVEVKSARTVHRLSRRTRDEDELIDILIDAAGELLRQLGIDSPAAHAAPPIVSRGRRGPVANVGLGLGAVSIIGGGVLYGSSWLTYSAHQDGQSTTADPTVTWTEAQAARRNAGIGIGLLAAGAVITTTSFLLPQKSQGAPSIAMVPLEGGGLMVMTFSL